MGIGCTNKEIVVPRSSHLGRYLEVLYAHFRLFRAGIVFGVVKSGDEEKGAGERFKAQVTRFSSQCMVVK
jgi:hypothetical protein